jgi:hypothetical protein
MCSKYEKMCNIITMILGHINKIDNEEIIQVSTEITKQTVLSYLLHQLR